MKAEASWAKAFDQVDLAPLEAAQEPSTDPNLEAEVTGRVDLESISDPIEADSVRHAAN